MPYILPNDLLQFIIEFLDISDFYAIKKDMLGWLCTTTYCRNVDILGKVPIWGAGTICGNTYWAILTNRLDIVKYAHKTLRLDDWAVDTACRQGNLEMVYFLVSKGLKGTPDSIINAIDIDNLDIVRFLHYHMGVTGSNNIIYAAEKGFKGIVEFLYTVRNTAWDMSLVFKSAAENNHLEVVKFMVSKGERCTDAFLIGDICQKGLFCMLEYLHGLGYISPDRQCFDAACNTGHMGIVKFLYNTGYYKTTPNTVGIAIRRRDVDMLKFLYSIKPFNPEQIRHSYESGHIPIIKFLYSMGCYPSPFIINTLCRMGKLDALKLIHKNGGKISPASVDIACEHGHTDLVKFLIRTVECVPTEHAMDRASLNGHTGIVRFLYNNTRGLCTDNSFNWSHMNCRHDVYNFLVSVRPFLDIQPPPNGITDIY
jgi:ankyrin repeat protein